MEILIKTHLFIYSGRKEIKMLNTISIIVALVVAILSFVVCLEIPSRSQSVVIGALPLFTPSVRYPDSLHSVRTEFRQILTAGIYIGKLEGFKELVNFKFDLQDKKLSEHNNFITRVYELERKDSIREEQIKVANNRIKDLEDKN